ncbi:MAG: RNA 2',3'-cyclic phosphodiesterase [Proteobacteria bacterium]|nr:RNA 2',3'-cyclic phosphodiesterase [Pseudomonadota bacterium]
MIRLFTAIRIPQAQKECLLATMGGLPQVRWQREDQLHLTLRFIGDVDEEKTEEIRLILPTLEFQPLSVRLKEVGIFGPARKPRMVWVGLENPEPVKALQEKITNTLRRVGVEPEDRKFKPHVTLARVKGNNGDKLTRFLEHYATLALDPFTVNEFALFRSHLSHTGAQYQVIETYPAGMV